MAELNRPTDPETSMAAALDAAAAALLGIWESAREGTANRVSGAQLRAVMVVEQYDGINLRRLATRLDMLLSSASRLCDRLVAAGMLEREPGRFDRREISLHLTPEARRLLAELRADRQAQLAAVLSGMSREGRDALLRGMREFDEAARRQQAQNASDESTGQEGWPDDPDRPGGRSGDWSADSGRQTRAVWTGSMDGSERSVGTTREWQGRDALLSGMREFDETARRQQTQNAPTRDESTGQGDWPDDPDRPGGRSGDWSDDAGRQTRTGWTGSSGGPERSVGTTREWSAGDPPVARTA